MYDAFGRDQRYLTGYVGKKKERYSALNNSTAIQRATAAALIGSQECVSEMRQVYQQRRDLAVHLLKELGRYVYTPHGAFYVLVDVSSPSGTGRRGRQFTLDLPRERNIAVAPGTTFGAVAEHYVRVSLATSDEEIVRGVREMCAFAHRY
jgi:aspartate aminotransferase/aminotransferase